MKKNYQKAISLGVIFFIAGNVSAQQQDSVKVSNIEEIKLTVGSRNKNRIVTDSPVPIDVINVKELAVAAPQTDLTQILNYVAPSFTSNTTTGRWHRSY